jgi:hypothetical protein
VRSLRQSTPYARVSSIAYRPVGASATTSTPRLEQAAQLVAKQSVIVGNQQAYGSSVSRLGPLHVAKAPAARHATCATDQVIVSEDGQRRTHHLAEAGNAARPHAA